MGINRTATALLLLFVGAMALLILRYDPWVYAGIIDNPLVSVPLTAALALAVGLSSTRRVADPGRAVVTRDGRFLRLDPRGRVPLTPGRDEIASVPSLAEHEVPHWPVTVFTADGGEHMVIFDFTWRLVPTAARPESLRERRILQSSEERCLRIAQQAVERVVRDVASCATVPMLRAWLTHPDCIDAIQERICALLDADALTVDRLHFQQLYVGKMPKVPAGAKVAGAAATATVSAAAPPRYGPPPAIPAPPRYGPQPPRLVPRGIGPEQLGPEMPMPGPM
ncbi:MAG TPA: hypothetical protein VIG30_07215 [Ktedonobacterales bacterium]|jgi:hypothetical protein